MRFWVLVLLLASGAVHAGFRTTMMNTVNGAGPFTSACHPSVGVAVAHAAGPGGDSMVLTAASQTSPSGGVFTARFNSDFQYAGTWAACFETETPGVGTLYGPGVVDPAVYFVPIGSSSTAVSWSHYPLALVVFCISLFFAAVGGFRVGFRP